MWFKLLGMTLSALQFSRRDVTGGAKYCILRIVVFQFIIPHVNFQWFDWSISRATILNVTWQCTYISSCFKSINVRICFRNGTFGYNEIKIIFFRGWCLYSGIRRTLKLMSIEVYNKLKMVRIAAKTALHWKDHNGPEWLASKDDNSFNCKLWMCSGHQTMYVHHAWRNTKLNDIYIVINKVYTSTDK